MIQLSDVIKVGLVGKSHGLKGEMNVAFDVDVDLEDMPYIIFDVDGIFVPFFITDYRFKNDMNALITLEDVGGDVAARQFYNSEVFMHKDFIDQIIEEEEDEFSPRLFLGYELIGEDGVSIGKVESVDDTTVNILFTVGEHLIPVAAIEVIDIDHDKLSIIVRLPEGLLELID